MARPEITGRKSGAPDVKSVAPVVKNAAPDVPPAAYTVREFCAAHRISVGMYYKLRRQGLGPREALVGVKPIVTLESAADWRREREAAAENAA